MASQVKLGEKNKEIALLKKMLAESRKSSREQPSPRQSTSNSIDGRIETVAVTPSRKRHSSQQLENHAKGVRCLSIGEFPMLPASQGLEAQAQVQPSTGQESGVWSAQSSSLQPVIPRDAPQAKRVLEVGSENMIDGVFDIKNEGAFREEIEVALESMNGLPFHGTISRPEAKVEIYHKCLGFKDFDNFDGIRFGHKGAPIVIFKLKTAINVDELFSIQYFDLVRSSNRAGAVHNDVIKCRIRGLRDPRLTSTVERRQENADPAVVDDGSRLVKIEGCDYRVPKEVLVEFLAHYGQVLSDVREEVFNDGLDGTNRTGIYSVMVKLHKELPQLVPLYGKRVKFYYKGIQKLCPNCFGPHHKQVCKSRKEKWIDYVSWFISQNQDIPGGLFGRWTDFVKNACAKIDGRKAYNTTKPSSTDTICNTKEVPTSSSVTTAVKPADPPMNPIQTEAATAEWLLKNTSVQAVQSGPDSGSTSQETTMGPLKRDFLVPETAEEHAELVDKLILGGSLRNEAEMIINGRIAAFNKACKDAKKPVAKSRKQYKRKSQQNQSLHATSTQNHYGTQN